MIDTGPPFYYNHLNAVNGLINPSTVHVSGTSLAQFYRKYLLQKAIARFDFSIPDTWAKNYFLYVLFCYGCLAVFNTDRFGGCCCLNLGPRMNRYVRNTCLLLHTIEVYGLLITQQ